MNQAEALEPHVSKLLVATGVLYALSAINTGIVFVNQGYEYQTVSGPLLLLGLLASLLALVGIHSKARDRTPTLAKATGGVAGLAAVAVVVLLVWGIASEVSSVPDSPAPLAIASILLFITSFTLAGATVLRSSVYTRPVGYLLLAEAVALVLVVALPMLVFQGTVPEEYTIGIELAQAIILLLAGSMTRSEAPGRQTAPTAAKEA